MLFGVAAGVPGPADRPGSAGLSQPPILEIDSGLGRRCFQMFSIHITSKKE